MKTSPLIIRLDSSLRFAPFRMTVRLASASGLSLLNKAEDILYLDTVGVQPPLKEIYLDAEPNLS